MNKILSIVLTLFMIITLSACAKKEVTDNNTNNDVPTSATNQNVVSTTQNNAENNGSNKDIYVDMLSNSHYHSNAGETSEFDYLYYTRGGGDTGYVIIKKYKGSSANVVIPDELNGYPVVGMYFSAFKDSDFVSDITFPDSFRDIVYFDNTDGYKCMSNTQWYQKQPDGVYYAGNVAIDYKGVMPQNTTITFRENTVAIGGCAFHSQKEMTGVVISDSILFISKYAFGGSGIVELTIPATLQYYAGAFSSCPKLLKVIFEEGVEKINGSVHGSNLTEIVFPSTLTEIGEFAFSHCGIETVVFPDSLKIIDENAFYFCEKLSSVRLNDGLEYIEDDAFMGCKALKSVFIPASVKLVSNKAFGFIFDDTPVKDFVAYYEEGAVVNNMVRAGVNCIIGTREDTQ